MNYIPINTFYENTTINYYRHWVAPFDGQLSKVIIYPSLDPGRTAVSFWKNGSNIEAITVTSVPANTSTTWTFTATSTFSAGDRLAVSVDGHNGAGGTGNTTATCVWLYDTAT